ncbi:Uma2 family endonuclease [Streptomyces sp. NBC_00564]|uniref:Uma2 family endonuclease n=1 Tax=Streptomyces sp. NBC_00564 TaxID=2903663 RepID=UPI00352C0DE4
MSSRSLLDGRRTVWLEFIAGRPAIKRGPDGNRSEILAWLQRVFAQDDLGLWFYPFRGLRTEADEAGRVRADGALAPARHFAGHGEWSSPEGVLMAVEVTADDVDTDRHNRVEKPDGYAAVGIPVYLLIDREDCSVVVFNQPEDGRYRREEKLPFGAAVKIPDPVNITLNTEPLKEFVD